MKRWMWYVLAAVVFALAAGGVLYGVLTHKEAGLMSVCWKNGVADYSGECQELKWRKSQLPLKYYIAFDEDHKSYIESVDKGAELWNKEIGVNLFQKTSDEKSASVLVTWGSYESGSDDCSAGHVSHTGDADGPQSAHVVLKNPSDVHAVYRYATHEFGHVLGLAHDEAPRSIMYPQQPDVTDEMTFVLPSDYDKKLLKEMYK